jgi:hypothetical protein
MQRPTTVTVFGILNIVFAALGIFGIIGSAVVLLAANGDTKNPVVQLIHDSPTYAAYLKVSVVLGLLVSLALLGAGIGLLLLKPWARGLSIAYGIFGIISVPVNTVLSYFFMTRPLLEQMQQQHHDAAATGAAVGGAVGGMIGGCFGLIYPVLLLVFMLRKDVAAAFKVEQGEAASD